MARQASVMPRVWTCVVFCVGFGRVSEESDGFVQIISWRAFHRTKGGFGISGRRRRRAALKVSRRTPDGHGLDVVRVGRVGWLLGGQSSQAARGVLLLVLA